MPVELDRLGEVVERQLGGGEVPGAGGPQSDAGGGHGTSLAAERWEGERAGDENRTRTVSLGS